MADRDLIGASAGARGWGHSRGPICPIGESTRRPERRRHRDSSAPAPAVWSTAPTLPLFCLRPARIWLTLELTGPSPATKCCIALADGQSLPCRSAWLLTLQLDTLGLARTRRPRRPLAWRCGSQRRGAAEGRRVPAFQNPDSTCASQQPGGRRRYPSRASKGGRCGSGRFGSPGPTRWPWRASVAHDQVANMSPRTEPGHRSPPALARVNRGNAPPASRN
jgi:hypothetical protein